MAIVPEPGRCDPALCNSGTTPFINFGSSDYTICDRTLPNTVPIKQLLKGSMAVPWVRLRFQGDKCPLLACVPSVPAGCTSPAGCVNPPDGSPVDEAYWDYTELTTGNISQPCNTEKCRAVIKSFQYGFGTTQSGNICKVVIHDESGSSFQSWFQRVIRNPFKQSGSGQSVNKMRIQFGWLVVGGDTGCPAEVTGNATCDDEPQTRLICSKAMWFVPLNLTANFQGNKFLYELEGRDLLMTGQNIPLQLTFGSQIVDGDNGQNNPLNQDGNTHFVDACVALGRKSKPPFVVQFAQLKEDGTDDTPQPLQFWREPNTGSGGITELPGHLEQHWHYVSPLGVPIGGLDYYKPVDNFSLDCTGPVEDAGSIPHCPAGQTTDDDLLYRGRLDIWRCRNQDPIGVLNDWKSKGILAETATARGGKGLTVNFDPTFEAPTDITLDPDMPTKGRVVIWGDAGSGSIRLNRNFNERKKALYVVNGGRCSPVFSFTTNIKWHWNALLTGGGTGPNTGQQHQAAESQRLGDDISSPLFNLEGPLPGAIDAAASDGQMEESEQAIRRVIRANQEHYLTNVPHDNIEAELRVQGDPSDWLITPFNAIGRNIAIVVINPFYLSGSDGVSGCPQWKQDPTTASPCHNVLTNVNWWIKGVEHSIKEGSFVTTIKCSLFWPGTEITPAPTETECGCPPGPMGVSGDAIAVTALLGLCSHGTGPCALSIGLGGLNVDPGAGNQVGGFCTMSENDIFNPCLFASLPLEVC